jgi:hypothetical protein
VDITLDSTGRTATIFIENLRTGSSHTYMQGTISPNRAGSAVEWVTEDTTAAAGYTKANTVRWQYGTAYWNSNFSPLSTLYQSAEYHIMNGGNTSNNNMAPTYPPANAFNNCPRQYLTTIPPTCS